MGNDSSRHVKDVGGAGFNDVMPEAVVFHEVAFEEAKSTLELDLDDLANSTEPTDQNDDAPSRAANPHKHPIKVYSGNELRNDEVIGAGGFGTVLKGNLHGKPVAVKIFHAPLPVKEIQEQLATLTRLQHRNIVTVLGILKSGAVDCPQVLLSYFPEGNLLQYLKNKDNPQDYAMLGKIALDIIYGCEYLHSKNIIHGNLAARNILVQKATTKQRIHYNAKVSDYGITRFVNGTGANYVKVSNGKVVPIRWAPKELVEENGINTDFTFESDHWSFGVVLWEMWTKGELPYGAACSNLDVLQKLKSGSNPLVDHRPKGCPDHVVCVMESIFKVNPPERPTFTMLKLAFEKFKAYGKDKGKAPQPAKEVKQSPQRSVASQDKSHKLEEQVRTNEAADGKVPKKKKNNKNQSKTMTANVDDDVAILQQMEEIHINTKSRHKSEQNQCATAGDQAHKVQSKWNQNQKPNIKAPNQYRKPHFVADSPQQKPEQGSQSQHQRSNQGARPKVKQEVLNQDHGNHKNQPHKPERQNKYKGGGGSFHRQAGAGVPLSHFRDPQVNPLSSNIPMNQPMMPPAPPPYTPTPLPNHSSPFPGGPQNFGHAPQQFNSIANIGQPVGPGNLGSGIDFDQKIRQHQDQIQLLHAQKMNQELVQKSAELAALVQQVTEQGINSNLGGAGLMNQQVVHGHGNRSRQPHTTQVFHSSNHQNKGRGGRSRSRGGVPGGMHVVSSNNNPQNQF